MDFLSKEIVCSPLVAKEDDCIDLLNCSDFKGKYLNLEDCWWNNVPDFDDPPKEIIINVKPVETSNEIVEQFLEKQNMEQKTVASTIKMPIFKIYKSEDEKNYDKYFYNMKSIIHDALNLLDYENYKMGPNLIPLAFKNINKSMEEFAKMEHLELQNPLLQKRIEQIISNSEAINNQPDTLLKEKTPMKSESLSHFYNTPTKLMQFLAQKYEEKKKPIDLFAEIKSELLRRKKKRRVDEIYKQDYFVKPLDNPQYPEEPEEEEKIQVLPSKIITKNNKLKTYTCQLCQKKLTVHPTQHNCKKKEIIPNKHCIYCGIPNPIKHECLQFINFLRGYKTKFITKKNIKGKINTYHCHLCDNDFKRLDHFRQRRCRFFILSHKQMGIKENFYANCEKCNVPIPIIDRDSKTITIARHDCLKKRARRRKIMPKDIEMIKCMGCKKNISKAYIKTHLRKGCSENIVREKKFNGLAEAIKNKNFDITPIIDMFELWKWDEEQFRTLLSYGNILKLIVGIKYMNAAAKSHFQIYGAADVLTPFIYLIYYRCSSPVLVSHYFKKGCDDKEAKIDFKRIFRLFFTIRSSNKDSEIFKKRRVPEGAKRVFQIKSNYCFITVKNLLNGEEHEKFVNIQRWVQDIFKNVDFTEISFQTKFDMFAINEIIKI